MPHRGADWGPKLTAAGFTVEGERTITVNLKSAPDNAVGRYALSSLRRLRQSAADALHAEAKNALYEVALRINRENGS